MDEKAAIAADAMELLLMNQTAIRASVEELSLWVSRRGFTQTHENVMAALAALDMHTKAISVGIERLRC